MSIPEQDNALYIRYLPRNRNTRGSILGQLQVEARGIYYHASKHRSFGSKKMSIPEQDNALHCDYTFDLCPETETLEEASSDKAAIRPGFLSMQDNPFIESLLHIY